MEFLCFGDYGPHKGSNGKVAVIGGCFEYTGAPYYAGVSALKSGSDLAHVFCTRSAGIPIKSYSPELIVHPTLDASDESQIEDFEEYSQKIFQKTTKWFRTMDVFVVGPGLGQDKFLVEHLVPKLIQNMYDKKKFLIFDADGIKLIIDRPDLIDKKSNIVVTPNKVEFVRLWESFVRTPAPVINVSEFGVRFRAIDDPDVQPAVVLARTMGVNLLIKGKVDVATDGNSVVCIGEPGSEKRVGGQGDVLCGVLSTTLFQAQTYGFDIIKALATASFVVRRSANIAFCLKQRGYTTPDLIKALPQGLISILSK